MNDEANRARIVGFSSFEEPFCTKMRTVVVLPSASQGQYVKPPQQMVYHLQQMPRVMQNPHVAMLPNKVVVQKTMISPVKTVRSGAVQMNTPLPISRAPVQPVPMVQLNRGVESSEASNSFICFETPRYLFMFLDVYIFAYTKYVRILY